jgi:Ca2+-binding EF-hand superfamily protein
MTRKLIVVAAAALLVPVMVGASEPEHAMRDSALEQWDANADGIVTRAEAEAAAVERTRRMFDALDGDGNGSLTRQEMDAAREKRHDAMREQAEQRFKAADIDGDGRLSKAEAKQGMPMLVRRFDELDADRDGALTSAELSAHKRRH